MRLVFDLSSKEAKNFLLGSDNYFSLDLPEYFDFSDLLTVISKKLKDSNYRALAKVGKTPRDYERVNYAICNNKKWEYSWRKQDLIHPVLYVALVNLMTEKENWEQIKDRVKSFSCTKIRCCSLPVTGSRNKSQKARSVESWYDTFIRPSIMASIDYDYMIATDISNCYDSFYAQSIIWALHGKDRQNQPREPVVQKSLYEIFAVEQQSTSKTNKLLGEEIAELIQAMTNGQMHGIPQGSVIMDLIAEIILGYIDTLINDKIKTIRDVKIIRYRDDYRIFTNNLLVAKKVLKIITETAMMFGLRLNEKKTIESHDIIADAVGRDRREWDRIKEQVLYGSRSLTKRLMAIRDFGVFYPNSGIVKTALMELYSENVGKLENKPNESDEIVAILIDIAYRNPVVYPHCCGVLSKILAFFDDDVRARYVDKIRKKFSDKINSEYLDIWLQRIALDISSEKDFREPICQLLYDKNAKIWNSDWLVEPIDDSTIVRKDIVDGLSPVIPVEVVKLFDEKSGSP